MQPIYPSILTFPLLTVHRPNLCQLKIVQSFDSHPAACLPSSQSFAISSLSRGSAAWTPHWGAELSGDHTTNLWFNLVTVPSTLVRIPLGLVSNWADHMAFPLTACTSSPPFLQAFMHCSSNLLRHPSSGSGYAAQPGSQNPPPSVLRTFFRITGTGIVARPLTQVWSLIHPVSPSRSASRLRLYAQPAGASEGWMSNGYQNGCLLTPPPMIRQPVYCTVTRQRSDQSTAAVLDTPDYAAFGHGNDGPSGLVHLVRSQGTDSSS